MTAPDILRYAAFTTQPGGGNPAGVVLDAATLTDAEMQQIAIDVDDAETAFVTGATGDGAVAVRYFSPVAEMPFCGHATVATAIALAERGLVAADEAIRFSTAAGEVSIDVSSDDTGIRAAFTSIDPVVSDLSAADTAAILALLGLDLDALDPDLPPRLSHAGNSHPVVALADRATFDGFVFDPTAARTLLDARGWPATITIIHRTGPDRFAARNIFPVGRITEDPATGSAAASTGAYLRELGAVEAPGRIVIDQGGHVGRPGTLIVDIPAAGGIVVSGYAVRL